MSINRVYFLASFLFLAIFTLPYAVSTLVFAQDSLEFELLPAEEELQIAEEVIEIIEESPEDIPPPLALENDDISQEIETPNSVETIEKTMENIENALPLAPFSPAEIEEPEEVIEEENDPEIEALLLDLAKDEELDKEDNSQDKKSVMKPRMVEGEPRPKWWEKEDKHKNQILPKVIYKKDYDRRNNHLPKSYDLSDLERWLFKTASDGDVNGSRALLNKGIDPDPRNVYGNTPLVMAAMNCKIGTVRLLLARGANPNVQNQLGLTPLHVASYKGCLDVTKVLLHMGANPNIKNEQGFTPIEFAATNKHYSVAQTLLNSGAHRTSRFFSGMIHEKSMLEAVKSGKIGAGKRNLPAKLPPQPTNDNEYGNQDKTPAIMPENKIDKHLDIEPDDETEDPQILKESLGIEPEEDPLSTTQIPTSKTMQHEAQADSINSDQDGTWKQTKGGRWTKIGGTEPPQGVAGIYWHSVDGTWYPLDPYNPDEVKIIEKLKYKLENGITDKAPASMQKKLSLEPDLELDKKIIPSLPAEVIEDMKPDLNNPLGAPAQGIGNVWWHEVDGEWQPLDPNSPTEAEEIEKLKMIHTPPAQVKPIPAPEEPDIFENLSTPPPLDEEPKLDIPTEVPITPKPTIDNEGINIPEAIMPDVDNSDIPIDPQVIIDAQNDELEELPELPPQEESPPIDLMPSEDDDMSLEDLELPKLEKMDSMPEIPIPNEIEAEINLIPKDEDDGWEPLPDLPDLPALE